MPCLVGDMAGQSGVADPRDVGVLLEPLSELLGVLGMALSAQTEGLNLAENPEAARAAKGLREAPKSAENLNTGTDDEGNGAKGVPELEAMVTFRRVGRTEGSRRRACPSRTLPESTMTPPMVGSWPPIHLVAECTTMSAPWSIGRTK